MKLVFYEGVVSESGFEVGAVLGDASTMLGRVDEGITRVEPRAIDGLQTNVLIGEHVNVLLEDFVVVLVRGAHASQLVH